MGNLFLTGKKREGVFGTVGNNIKTKILKLIMYMEYITLVCYKQEDKDMIYITKVPSNTTSWHILKIKRTTDLL